MKLDSNGDKPPPEPLNNVENMDNLILLYFSRGLCERGVQKGPQRPQMGPSTGKSCSCWKLMNDLLAMLVLIEACIYARSGKYHGLASNILFLWSSSYIMGMNPVCLSLIVQSDGQRTSSKWIACAVLTKHKFPEYEILLNWFRWYSCDWRKPWDSQTEKPFSNSRICKITEKGQLDQL